MIADLGADDHPQFDDPQTLPAGQRSRVEHGA